ncbi:inverse autotransporter beta domain-containing protein [Pantoea sp. SOD02]|uniref:inverse autotransporter beta domain-containing protein n=1 Tax=Pantoea sp. SOD02 TaxID=2970818 RepID=UPI0021572E6E|nr:inverse autotransporter beta domain-containing protein [Pantoea sp. SOD02]UVC31677.1 inverse autotransporter beta domain-containing protein [Pantoea sp. SOD02]
MKNKNGKLSSGLKFVSWMNICVQCTLPIISTLAVLPARAQSSEMVRQADEEDQQTRTLAGVANSAGSFLANNPDSDVANSMLRNYATGEAGAQAQQWLSQFGTARVQLDVDNNFSLKNSQFDLMVPFYESPDKLLFTQASLHRSDDRSQSNLGLGYRQFNNNWMFGLNSFIDYDISRQHARVGFGAEYWRDFLKFSANSYHRLTSWRDSPDLEDYQERPANGWDIRAEGWLPAYAQLGGKLTYEQYYGDEVALFGRDNRQKDPRAITAGITYTPIPLFTLSAEQRQGQSGAHDTRFGLEMNYQLGLSWQQQINSDRVAGMRSLSGSRYDLVARNNNIVLDYRKKEVISLNVVKSIQGRSGEQKPVNVQVNSKHGLHHIDWTAAELTAAGGQILSEGASHSVVFPAWKSGPDAVNRYTLHGVAVDSKGNRSARSETVIEVNSPAISLQNSVLTPIDGALPADGQSKLVMTLSVRDDQQQPVDVDTADIAVTFKAARQVQGATLSSPERKSAGVFELVLTSGAQEQPLILTPTVKGIALADVTVNVLKDLPDSSESSMDVADENSDAPILSFTAKDAAGNPISGIADKLGLAVKDSHGADAGATVTFGPITETRAGGKYQTTLKATQADAYVITPTFSGVPMNHLSASVNLTGNSVPDASRSTWIATPTSIPADDVTTSALTFSAFDAQGKPVMGIADRLTLAARAADGSEVGSGISLDKLVESSQRGIYTTTLKGSAAGTYSITPRFDGAELSNLIANVTLIEASDVDIDDTASTLDVDPVFIATHRDSATLNFYAVDKQSQPINGLGDKLAFDVKASNGSATGSEIVVDNIKDHGSAGYYTATVHGTQADAYTITAKINGKIIDKIATTVLLYDSPDGAQSTFTAQTDSRQKEDIVSSTLTFVARDAQGQLVNNITPKLSVRVTAQNGSAASATPFAMRSTRGIYIATFEGSKNDTYTLTMQFEGRDLAGTQPLVLNFNSGVVEVDHLEANSHSFNSDSGFPRTAYPGASFKVHLKDADPSDFDWDAGNTSAVSVDANGVVTIGDKSAAGKDIVITATAKQGGANTSYRFRINEWFNPVGRQGPASYLPILCNGSDDNDMPELSKMSLGTNVRGVGTLWSEWGNALPYMMWAKDESNGPSYNSYMNGSNGQTGFFSATNPMDIVCSSHHG